MTKKGTRLIAFRTIVTCLGLVNIIMAKRIYSKLFVGSRQQVEVELYKNTRSNVETGMVCRVPARNQSVWINNDEYIRKGEAITISSSKYHRSQEHVDLLLYYNNSRTNGVLLTRSGLYILTRREDKFPDRDIRYTLKPKNEECTERVDASPIDHQQIEYIDISYFLR